MRVRVRVRVLCTYVHLQHNKSALYVCLSTTYQLNNTTITLQTNNTTKQQHDNTTTLQHNNTSTQHPNTITQKHKIICMHVCAGCERGATDAETTASKLWDRVISCFQRAGDKALEPRPQTQGPRNPYNRCHVEVADLAGEVELSQYDLEEECARVYKCVRGSDTRMCFSLILTAASAKTRRHQGRQRLSLLNKASFFP